tara:strand:+ start:9163 stop:10152 length:990 start_codon:yes stop_codon:yes gene_type:complete
VEQMSQLEVLKLLADGRNHSREKIIESFGLPSSLLSEYIKNFGNLGLDLVVDCKKSYRLSRPIEFLDTNKILSPLCDSMTQKIYRLEIFQELESTNSYLLDTFVPKARRLSVCLAEYQSSGRGRFGRKWSAPFGGSLCISMGWVFDEKPENLSALSLSAAVVVRQVIGDLTNCYPMIKWPNDLVWKDKKLGGILTESSPKKDGSLYVVVGIGINLSMNSAWLSKVCDWPEGATDLSSISSGEPLKNLLASRLIEGIYTMLESYSRTGFSSHIDDFASANYLKGRKVSLLGEGSDLSGVVASVDSDGSLLLETKTGSHRIVAGEVSLRAS